MSDWEDRRLDEVSSIIDSLHRTPSYASAGYPMVRVTDVKGGFLDLSEAFFVTEDVFKEFTRRHAPTMGDIVISRVGTYGNASFVNTDLPFCLGQNTAIISPKINARFLHLCLESPLVKRQIEETVVGSTQKTISLKNISSLRIPFPPLTEQEAIAHILGTLDDKLELNRRMNETLEAMARALFKSWFVDFDPVRAKAEGRPPVGLDADTAALFPSTFTESQLGPIPDGWLVKNIADLTQEIQYGFTQSASNEAIGPRFLRITDIRGGRIDWSRVPFCKVTEEEFDRYRIQPGDVFVARTGASTGDNVYTVRCPDAVFASYLVRFTFVRLPEARYVGEFMRTGEYFNFLEGVIGGSAQPNASARVLASASLVVPGNKVLDAFAEFVAPLDLRRFENDEQAQTLVALRDALLPKLISGEIRVADAEHLVNSQQ